MLCSQKKSSYIKDKIELDPKTHLVINKYGMPINFIVTDGSHADCKETIHLIKNINAKFVFTDCACDTNEILPYLNQRNIKPVIPPKRNCLNHRYYKDFKVLKKKDNSFIVNFIVPVISLKIFSLP